MIFVNINNTFADLFFIIGILGICVIWVTISMYKEATEKQETQVKSDQNADIGMLQEKYQELMDRNIKLAEEISRLRFENSYLSNQTYSSDLKSDSEFQKNLKDLIILSHPDKHGGHDRAMRITQWLLQLRK